MDTGRRQFLRGVSGAASALLAASTLGSSPARAAMACTGWWPYNGAQVRTCRVGVEVGVLRAQECDQWCWAACIQAAFSIAGHDVEQRAIVEKLYGPNYNCRPAMGPGIAQAIEGYWVDNRGRQFRASSQVLADLQFGIANPYALQQASQYLARDVPLINGALGHATLMTAMTWDEDNLGNSVLKEIVVRDPWPQSPNRRTLTAREVAGGMYLAAVFVA